MSVSKIVLLVAEESENEKSLAAYRATSNSLRCFTQDEIDSGLGFSSYETKSFISCHFLDSCDIGTLALSTDQRPKVTVDPIICISSPIA